MNPVGSGGAPPQSDLPGPYLGEVVIENYRHSSAETAAVYFYANGARVVVRSDGRQLDRLPRIRRPTAISRVALGLHHTRVRETFPARGGGRFFRAELDVVWEVTDPIRVAERQLRDVRILLPDLTHRLRAITARHRISDLDGANAEIGHFLEASHRASVGADYGLDARVYVRLDLDEAEIKGIASIDNDRWQAQLEENRRLRLQRTLAGGDLERAAALTAADPANLSTAISMLTESDRTNRQEMIRFFQYLVDTGVVSRSQLNQQAQAMLGWVQSGGDPSVPLSVGWEHAIDPPRSRRALAIEPAPQPGGPEVGGGRRQAPARGPGGWDESDDEPPARTRGRSGERGWDEPDDKPVDRSRPRGWKGPDDDEPVTGSRTRGWGEVDDEPVERCRGPGWDESKEHPVRRGWSGPDVRSRSDGQRRPADSDGRRSYAEPGPDRRPSPVDTDDDRSPGHPAPVPSVVDASDGDPDGRWHVPSRRIDRPAERGRRDDWADPELTSPPRSRRDQREDDGWGR